MRDTALTWLAHFIWRRPGTVLIVATLLAVVGAVYAGTRLRLNADTNDLISPYRPFMKDFRAFMREFGDTEYIYVVVANDGDISRTRRAVDELTRRLRAIQNLPGVFSAVTVNEQLRLATRAMPLDELENLSLASGAFTFIS